ncbi:hypothetical protein PJP13_29815, partial [Mycobacterium kansasii]
HFTLLLTEQPWPIIKGLFQPQKGARAHPLPTPIFSHQFLLFKLLHLAAGSLFLQKPKGILGTKFQ